MQPPPTPTPPMKKKTVVINLEYMRPTPEPKNRSRSRHITDDSSNDDADDSDEYDDGDSKTTSSSATNTDMELEYALTAASAAATTATTAASAPDINKYQPCDSDYAVDSDEDLLQSVLDEPTFPLDVNAILAAMTKEDNATIANMTFKQIETRRCEILSSLELPTEKYDVFCKKLQMYRVIERPQDLRHGQLLRWIPLRSLSQNPYLTLGGTIFNVKQNITDGLHQVTIRNVKGFVYQIKFELNVMFQRLSKDELLILRAVDYVSDVKL
jgi:hypothetical protein